MKATWPPQAQQPHLWRGHNSHALIRRPLYPQHFTPGQGRAGHRLPPQSCCLSLSQRRRGNHRADASRDQNPKAARARACTSRAPARAAVPAAPRGFSPPAARLGTTRPAETIFACLSAPRHQLSEPGDSEGQGEEGKHTYRFFGIPVTLKGRGPQFKETRQLTPGPIGLGTIFEQISTLHGRIQKSKIKISEYEPPRIITFTYGPTPLRFRTILTPASGNTILTMTITIIGSGCHPLIR